MKNVLSIHRGGEPHWVGDGFPVRTVFHYEDLGPELTPFLLLDHAGPADFAPTQDQRGVGWHPHRGFETVTIVYDGEVDHEDSAGNQGSVGPGDVQWMTAGSGVLHKELHGRDFARRGGRFAARTSNSFTPRAHRLPRSAIACPRSPRPNARTSSACSKRYSGTRRKLHGCSISVAGRCIARSTNTASSLNHGRELRVARAIPKRSVPTCRL